MPVYLPTSIVGNSRILVTLGGAGEIMGFFYPHVDHAQNVHECMVALYLGEPTRGRLLWTFDDEWAREQAYAPGTNILVTTLTNRSRHLRLTITDFVPLHTDALVRRFVVENTGRAHFVGRLFQYFDLNLGEVPSRDAVRRLTNEHAVVQEWRHLCFAVGGSEFDAFQCGKAIAGAASNAKEDLNDGALSGQRLDIGNVNFAVGWALALPPRGAATFHLAIVPARGEHAALQNLRGLHKRGWEALRAETEAAWQGWLARAKPVQVPPPLDLCYQRCLLTLPLLFDVHHGTFLAAPEFDPDFQESGGYGYCWPRDAAEVVVALADAGCPDYAERFFHWCGRTQDRAGFWHQRYWISGEVGPTWCTYDDAIQIDQTASVLWAMGCFAQTLSPERRARFLRRHWRTVRRAAAYLRAALGEDDLHRPAYDLWESFRGSFTYSNAAICAALHAAAQFAKAVGRDNLAAAWTEAAQRVKRACLRYLWNGKQFARGVINGQQLDWSVDSSVLGVLDPFGMLSLEDDAERQQVESVVRVIEGALAASIDGGRGIKRFENDVYAGGPPGTVNTLWLSRVLLQLALHHVSKRNLPRAQTLREHALAYLRAALRRTTPSGLLPELMGGAFGKPYWAAPHGWAMASLVRNMLLLDELNGRLDVGGVG